jgi:hypothetical protein
MLVWVAGVSPAAATPAVRATLPAPTLVEAITPDLQLLVTAGPVPSLAESDVAHRLRLGLGLPDLRLAPLLVEIDTLLGPVRLEFLSLGELQFQGSLVRVLEDAVPASSPSTIFDRTELLDRYVVAVPIIWF